MKFTLEQRQKAYKRLPPDIQDLVMDNETADLIANALKETGLNKEQADLADSEILYTLFCLQSLNDAINNTAKLSNKNPNDLFKLKSTIQDKILSQYKIDIKEFIETNKLKPVASASAPEIAPTNNLPMVEKGEVAHDVPHVEQPKRETKPEQKLNASLPDYRYGGGKDPYREPLK